MLAIPIQERIAADKRPTSAILDGNNILDGTFPDYCPGAVMLPCFV
jgi:hypothetical protein